MPPQELVRQLLELSQARSWADAKLEWSLDYIFEVEDPRTCACLHYPIKEVCVIRNNITGHELMVGNCCVKNFMGLHSDELFNSLKRIQKDISKSLSAVTVEY